MRFRSLGNDMAHLFRSSQPPPVPGLPTMASAHTAAYVGSKCANWPGPPANPPSGCCIASNVSIVLGHNQCEIAATGAYEARLTVAWSPHPAQRPLH